MTTQFLNVPQGRLAYEVTGPADGRLVVLAHGAGDTRRMFRFLVPSLAEAGYRVAALDVRGYGDSGTGWPDYSVQAVADDIRALIRHLGGPALLLGHSIAVASALWAAAENPDDVSAVILVGGAAEKHQLKPYMRWIARRVASSATLWLAYYSSLYPTAKPADFAGYKRDLKASLRRKGGRDALRAQVAEAMAGPPLRYGEVHKPTLVVMGTKDPDFPDPTAEARLAVRKLADGRLTLVEGAGHYPFAEMPDATTPAILKFLSEV